MRFITTVAGVAVVIAIGGIATRAPALAGATTTAATTTPGAAAPSTGTSSPAPVSRCDDGDWRGPAGVNVDGRPDDLDAGDRGAVFASFIVTRSA